MATKIYIGDNQINAAYLGANPLYFGDSLVPGPAPQGTPPDQITSATLLGWWDYSSYSGSEGTWYDKSGNGYDLTRTGSGDIASDQAVLFNSGSSYYNTSSAAIDNLGDIQAPFTYMAFFKPPAGYQFDGIPIMTAMSRSFDGFSYDRHFPFNISKAGSGSALPESGSLEVDPPFGSETVENFMLTASQWEMITVNPTTPDAGGSQVLYNRDTLVDTLSYSPLEGNTTVETRPGFWIAGDATTRYAPPPGSGSYGAFCVFTGSISTDDILEIYYYYSASYGYAQ